MVSQLVGEGLQGLHHYMAFGKEADCKGLNCTEPVFAKRLLMTVTIL
jgi:hypothetical protein